MHACAIVIVHACTEAIGYAWHIFVRQHIAYTVADLRDIAMAIGHVHTPLAVHVRTMTRRNHDETTTKP